MLSQVKQLTEMEGMSVFMYLRCNSVIILVVQNV